MLSIILVFFIGNGNFAWSAPQILTQNNMVSEEFTCIENAKPGILEKYGITTPGATSSEHAMVANALQRLDNISGGNFPYFKHKNVTFREELTSKNRGCIGGQQTAQGMVLARKVCHKAAQYNAWKRKTNPSFQGLSAGQRIATNETTITHEIGHKVGNTNGNYYAYAKAVRPRCMLSHYCTNPSPQHKRGEEFSEAFAVFVADPGYLAKACPSAYNFFKNKIFKMAGDPPACHGGKTRYVDAPGKKWARMASPETYGREAPENCDYSKINSGRNSYNFPSEPVQTTNFFALLFGFLNQPKPVVAPKILGQ